MIRQDSALLFLLGLRSGQRFLGPSYEFSEPLGVIDLVANQEEVI